MENNNESKTAKLDQLIDKLVSENTECIEVKSEELSNLDNSNKHHEYRVFVFRRGNSFNGFKLDEKGAIIHWNREGTEYIDKNEMTIEHKYGKDANSQAYEFLSSVFTEGDVLQITCTIDENGIFNKKIEKVMDKEFCTNTLNSWNSIKHHWFHPEAASQRIEEHIASLT